jgi:HTH-type transcriptional regulator, competence development regulator
MKSLGKTIKEARELISLTLRQVEEASGISNSYLSQLENDKIKKPSANVLYKLSTMYNMDLDILLAAAGIIDKPTKIQAGLLGKISAASELSATEEDQLLKYLKFLRTT